jgi:hypothetical protein
MAYKKSRKKKTTPKRRKKIGAVGMKGINVMGAVTLIAGAVAGRYLVKAVNIPNMNIKDEVKNAVVIAAGLFLPRFVKSETGKQIGAGMVAAGGIGLASSLIPKIAGIEDTLSFPMMVSGTEGGDLSLISGDNSVMSGDDLSLIAGMDDDDYNY